MQSTQALVSHPYRKGPPDAIGLAAAQAAQDAAAPATVILFGSRARGDWREHSDIDLLLIVPERDGRLTESRAYSAAKKYCQRQGVQVDVGVNVLTVAEFERCRRAKQHIAGQADAYGVVMSGAELEPQDGYEDGYEDGYPDHWPETVKRIRNAESWMQDYSERVELDHWNQRLMGLSAQQAVENGLKGVLSAHNVAGSFTHDLLQCWAGVLRLESDNPPAAELVQAGLTLFAHVDFPQPEHPELPQDWLTMYAVIYRYGDMPDYVVRAQRLELYELVSSFVTALVKHIYWLSGTSERDVYPDGQRPWESHQPES